MSALLRMRRRFILTNYTNGLDALNALTATNDGGNGGAEFTPLKSNTSIKVKIVDKAAVQLAYSYSIFKKVNSFVAANPSTRDKFGNAKDNLTPWDKAAAYYKAKSEVYTDANGVEASKYRAKPRFAMAFWSVEDGAVIIVDLSKNQAQAVAASIAKYEKKLDKLAFELSKEGEGTSTKVSLSPILDMDEDLTDKERENFAKAPAEIPPSTFDGIWYEQDEAQMVDLLKQAGFDPSLIGYDASSAPTDAPPPGDIDDGDLPF